MGLIRRRKVARWAFGALCCNGSVVLIAERLPMPRVRRERRARRLRARKGLRTESLAHEPQRSPEGRQIEYPIDTPGFQRSGVARSIFRPSGCVRKGLAAAGGRIVRRRPGEGGELPTRRPALSRPSDETLVKVGCGAINHHKLEARNIEGAKLRSCCFSAIGVKRRNLPPAIASPDHTKGSHLRRRPTRRPSFGEWSVLIATLALLALAAFSGFE